MTATGSRRQSHLQRCCRVVAALTAGLVVTSIGVAAAPATRVAARPATASHLDAKTPTTQLRSAGLPRAGRSQSEETQRVRWNDTEGTSRVGTVTVSKTKQLATREIVSISWNGFLPTMQEDGVESTHQAPQAPSRSAYPVVILECQGSDADKLTPEDCPLPQRFYYYSTSDALETDAVKAASPYDSRPFLDTAGKLHKAPGVYQPVEMPSDYSDDNVIGTNWYATWSEQDGTRADAKFEVRSTKEAPESLGCGDPPTREHGKCSIVVVPIRPLHCVDATSCLPPEETNAYSASYLQWQSASNWKNKFVFPVTFKPFPDVCDLDSRPAVPTMGSQLLDEAMLSWVPKFCQSKELFKLSFTRTNDSAARAALTTGVAGSYQSDLSFTTKPVLSIRHRPIVNAPVAVTGFVVAMALDDKNYEEIDSMRLNARLIAKLVTESYSVPPIPYLAKNPSDLLHDPEFRKLNPHLLPKLDPYATIDNPVLMQGNPDLAWEVTRYIASNPEAVAWLGGKADPWGMKVNPHYKGKQWPVPSEGFELRDPWTEKHPSSGSDCEPKPVMEKQAQFVYDLLAATIALVDRQPQNFGVCKVSGQGGDVFAWAKPDRQPLGRRSMIAITDLAHAEQYQLPSAALETHNGSFVTPSPRSLKAAIKVAIVDKKTKTISSNMTSSSKAAYPGMMAVYAAAPTKGLSAADAAAYGRMISWMATTGQTYGDAAGRLPAGYLALPKAMRQQALEDSRHVAAQDGFGALPTEDDPPTTAPTSTSTPTSDPSPTPSTTIAGGPYPTTTSASSAAGSPSTGDVPTSAGPTSAAAPTTSSAGAPVARGQTVSQSSPLAHNLLPVLVSVSGMGILASLLLLGASHVSTVGGVAEAKRRLLAKLWRF